MVYPKMTQELHSTVSEVIDRVDSQEMKSNTELRSFDDSSFFTFPSQDGVSITSSQASHSVKGVSAVNSQKDSSGIHNFQSGVLHLRSQRHHSKSHQMTMTSTLKPSFFHNLETRLFGNCSSSGPKS
jgi:hypothetical protein